MRYSGWADPSFSHAADADPDSARNRRIIQDYVVSTTIRKMDQRGPKWESVKSERRTGDSAWRLSPPSGMDEVYNAQTKTGMRLRAVEWPVLSPPDSFGIPRWQSLDLISDPSARLAALLRHASAVTRWEPLNGATLHRGVPSGGGLYGADIHLAGYMGGSVGHYTYLPHDGVLRQDGGQVAEVLGDSGLAMVITADVARYLQPYGEFAPVLAFLEAGFLVALLQSLLASCGWSPHVTMLHSYKTLSGQLALGHWSTLPVAILRIDRREARQALTNWEPRRLATCEQLSPLEDLDRYPRVGALLEAVEETKPIGSRPASDHVSPVSNFDLLAAIRGRSSGLPLSSNPDRKPFTDGELDAIIGRLRGLQDDRRSDLGTVALRLAAVTTGASGSRRVHDVNLIDGTVSDRPMPPGIGAPGPLERERRCSIALAVDDVVEIDRVGPRSFVTSHLAAGVLGQRVCLAASGSTQIARPLRGYPERDSDALFPLEWRTILQVAIDEERRSNPAFPLNLG